jgi:hypothetical protein
MGALASTAVTRNTFYKVDGASSRQHKVSVATLVLTGQGGLTNNIPAALFGLTKVLYVKQCTDTASNQILAGPSYDGKYVVLAATNGTPNDYTATVRITVVGNE